MSDGTHLTTWVTRETKERFAAVARHQGLSDSALLKRLVDLMLQSASAAEVGTPGGADRTFRDSRLTVRIRPDDQLLLRERAAARGMIFGAASSQVLPCRSIHSEEAGFKTLRTTASAMLRVFVMTRSCRRLGMKSCKLIRLGRLAETGRAQIAPIASRTLMHGTQVRRTETRRRVAFVGSSVGAHGLPVRTSM
jgi:hypothetical protein